MPGDVRIVDPEWPPRRPGPPARSPSSAQDEAPPRPPPPESEEPAPVQSLGPARFKTSKRNKRGDVIESLSYKLLGQATMEAGHVRVGTDRRLWTYAGGVYQPEGDDFVERFVCEAMDDDFRSTQIEEVKRWLRAHEPTITDEQPRHLLNVRNGLLDWRTGKLRPHTPDEPSTIQLPVTFDPEATCPEVEEFLRQAMPEDAYEFALEVIAYVLWPEGNPFRKAVQLLGPTGTGKSVFLNLLTALVGDDNCSAVPLQTLAEDRFAAADLYGKLANISGDLDARQVQRSDVFKMMTGGDVIRADIKFGQPFKFRWPGVAVFSANEAPRTRDQSDAWLGRWLILPMVNQVPERAQDRGLTDRLTQPSELSGLLNLALDSMHHLERSRSFTEPASVREAKEQYSRDVNTVAAWCEECVELDPDSTVSRREVRTSYERWCEDEGRPPLAAGRQYERILAKYGEQVTEFKTNGSRGFKGLRVTLPPSI